MTTESKVDGAPAGPAVLRGQETYLPSAVEAYRSRSRGARRAGFDPGTMQPRWRSTRIALLVLALLLGASLAIPVRVGAAGTLVDAGQDLAVVVLASNQPIGWQSAVNLRYGSQLLAGTVVSEQLVDSGQQSARVVTVELERRGALDEDALGSRVVLERGTRPLLLDLVRRGRP